MRKLYRLKTWYSLEDAANRLSLTLDEPVTVQDLKQLMADGHISAYWNVLGKQAREVAPVTWLYRQGDPVFEAAKEFGRIPEGTQGIVMEGFEPQEDCIRRIDGLFKIDTQHIGASRYWLRSIAEGNESDYMSLDGSVLVGEDGKFWQLMKHFSENEGAEYFKPQGSYLEDFYPTFDLPDPSEIVLSRSELEKFEAQFLEPPKVQKPLTTHERNTLLVLIAALCKKARIDPAAKGAAGELVQLARAEGINVDIDPDTVRGKLKQIPDALGARQK